MAGLPPIKLHAARMMRLFSSRRESITADPRAPTGTRCRGCLPSPQPHRPRRHSRSHRTALSAIGQDAAGRLNHESKPELPRSQ
jgi:hypothetical protein